MEEFKIFTGGDYETNSFLLQAPRGGILFDAPEGADAHFANEPVGLLVLTHGHWDHTQDAAAIKRRHGCPVMCHEDTVPMITDANFFRRVGFPVGVEPLEPDKLVCEGAGQDLLGWRFDVLEVPGHCPGSLCFHLPQTGLLVGGDVLFRGGIGRWDLPGGDGELLLDGIRKKILPLPDATMVLPGHGPLTTIGEEREGNPFLRL
ncbi:MAG: MBL fold metallo-hydrolase [Chthoniobacterales bacterium]|nr:MBL fold metallo-hydrolase [Chthoniobacterales bacterium]